jgi:hypothetical protein
MEGPEGEEVELLGGAGEVLAVKVEDLADEGLVRGFDSDVGRGVHKSP